MTSYECQGFCNAMQNFCPYKQIRQAEQSGPKFDFSNQSPCGRARRLAEYCLADLAAHTEKDKFKGDCTALSKRADGICTRTKALNPPPNPVADTKAAAVLDLPKPATDAVPVNLNNSSPAEPPTPIIREKPASKATLGPASPCGQVLRAQEVCKDTCGKVEKPEEQAICLKDCDSLRSDIEKLCPFTSKPKRKNAIAVVSPKGKGSKSNTAVCKTCSTARSASVAPEGTPRRIESGVTRSEGPSSTRSFGTGATSGGGLATSQTRSISTGVPNSGSGSQTRTMSPSGVQNIGGASATSRDRPK